jgi:hypothetical protein
MRKVMVTRVAAGVRLTLLDGDAEVWWGEEWTATTQGGLELD